MVKKLSMLMGSLFRKKYVKVYIVKKLKKQVQIISVQWINIINTNFSIGKHTYTLKLEDVVLTRKGKPELYYEQNNDTPLTFNATPNKVNNSQLTAYMKTRLFQNLLFHKREKQFFMVIGFLVIVIVGVGAYGVYGIQESQKGFLETIEKIVNATIGVK